MLKSGDIDVDFVPERRASLASVAIEGEGLVFDESNGSWHYLNPVARIIWDCCDGSGTVQEVVDDISDIFDMDLETIRDSVLDTLREFGQKGLLEGVEDSDSKQREGDGHDHDHGPDLEVPQPEPGETDEAGRPRFVAVPPSS